MDRPVLEQRFFLVLTGFVVINLSTAWLTNAHLIQSIQTVTSVVLGWYARGTADGLIRRHQQLTQQGPA